MNNRILFLFIVAIFLYSFNLSVWPNMVYAEDSTYGREHSRIADNKTEKVTRTQANNYSKNLHKRTASNKYKNIKPVEINWPELLIGAIIGWLAGLFSVLLIDKLKEPNLVFEAGSISEDNSNKWRFIHIRIKNLKNKHWYNPFTSSPAFACKAIIKIGDKSFIGRWTSKEQPIGNISEVINKALVHPREDIYPYTVEQEAVELAIGIKYETEDEFYGFNNESYLHSQAGFRNTSNLFGIGKFDGEAIISTLGQIYTQKFIIHNKSKKRKDFWVELIN